MRGHSADWWALKCDLLARVKERFDAANLDLAYRRHDVVPFMAPEPAGGDRPQMEASRISIGAAAAVSQANGADRTQ